MKQFFSLLLFGLLFGVLSGGVAQAQDKTFINSIGMEFVLIPAGKSTYKWTVKNDLGEDIQKQLVVTISKPFYLGKYEVTQEEWVAVVGNNPSQYKRGTNPVENMPWKDVQVFIAKLNLLEGGNLKEGANKYRLPTAAEWDHAARAGTDTKWFFGNDLVDLGDYAWFKGNSQGTTHPVGEKKPNPWGLYDIYGNVFEWVQDWLPNEDMEGVVTDPTGPESGTYRRLKDGGWFSDADHWGEATCKPDDRDCVFGGFRLAFSPGQ